MYNRIFPLILMSILLTGCATRHMNATVAPMFRDEVTPISALAVTGDGATIALAAFMEHGYKVVDLGKKSNDPVEEAKNRSLPYLATVDPVGTDGSFWDGVFDYAIRVTEVNSGNVIWTATAEYSASGGMIDQVKSSKDAMEDMVSNFEMTFPPANSSSPRKQKDNHTRVIQPAP